MKNLRVLITGVGSTTSLSVIKGLRQQTQFGVYIVGVDVNLPSEISGSNFCDKFYTIPPASNEKKYIDTLNDLIKSESIDLVIPIVDPELEVISRNKEALDDSAFLLLSSYQTVETCLDKMQIFSFFKENNIPTPKTIPVDQNSDVKGIAQDFSFPLIVKPRTGVSSRDVYEVRNEQELCLLNRVKNPIIQQMAKGQEYTIDVFCNAGKVVSAVPRMRIETRAGISYKGQTEKDETLINYASRIAEKLNIKGPANVQCFKDGEQVLFIEVNPRFSGGLPLTIAAGVNTPLFALKMAAGEEIAPVSDFKIVKMCRFWDEIFYER